MDVTIKLDDREVRRALAAFDAESKKETSEIMLQQGRLFIFDVVSITPPASRKAVGMDAKKQGEATLTSDLNRIFRKVDDAQMARLMVRPGPKEFINNYAHAGAAAIGTVKKKVLSFSEMAQWHKERRRPSDGRVKQVDRNVTTGHRKMDLPGLEEGFVSESDFNRYLKQQLRLVGILASGWNAAAARLGLRLPAWISRHGSSRGAISMEFTGTDMKITMTNAVPFVGNVRDLQRRCQWALDKRAAKMFNQLENFAQTRAAKKCGL